MKRGMDAGMESINVGKTKEDTNWIWTTEDASIMKMGHARHEHRLDHGKH